MPVGNVLAALVLSFVAQDAKLVDLPDGFVRVDTPAYSFEIPKGWAVGEETRWGARDMKPVKGAGGLGAMTAGPTNSGWDGLYRTSLWFIRREVPGGKPTPYRIERSAQGYEACTFSILDEQDRPVRRYALLKGKTGKVLALSVKIPTGAEAKSLEAIFDRFVRSARIKE